MASPGVTSRELPRELHAKMQDPNHALTQLISRLLEDTHEVDPDDQSLNAKVVRAIRRSKTIEHYDVLYAAWDTPGVLQAPMRAFVRLVCNVISASA